MHKPQDDGLQQRIAAAIKISQKIGIALASNHPEIAQLYVDGATQEDLAVQFVHQQYDVSAAVGKTSIQEALKILIPDYEERMEIGVVHLQQGGVRNYIEGVGIFGLDEETMYGIRSAGGMASHKEGKGIFALSKEERRIAGVRGGTTSRNQQKGVHGLSSEKLSAAGTRAYELGRGVHGLSKEVRRKFSRKAGESSYERGVGVHAMTTEQRREIGLALKEAEKGCHALTTEERRDIGLRAAKEGTGIHAFTTEQRREVAKKAMETLGFIMWYGDLIDEETGMQEGDYCLLLAEKKEFQHQGGRGKGRPNKQKITEELNQRFHNGEEVRTLSAVKTFLSRSRKK